METTFSELPQSDEDHDKNKEKLKAILNSEKGHDQWDKQFINIAIFLALIALNIFRGSKKNPSIFGVKTCSGSDWISLLIFICFCVATTAYSIR